MKSKITRSIERKQTSTQEKPHTIAHVRREQDFKFLFDIRIEESVKIKPVWSLLPPREVCQFIPMHDIAFCPKLADVAHLGVYSREEEAAIRYCAVAHVARSIIPCEAHSS